MSPLQIPHPPGSHNSSTAVPYKAASATHCFKIATCSSLVSRRACLGSLRAQFSCRYIPHSSWHSAESKEGRADAFLLLLLRNLCCCTHATSAVVHTQPLLLYTRCLLEGEKQFGAVMAFYLPGQLFSSPRSHTLCMIIPVLVLMQTSHKA